MGGGDSAANDKRERRISRYSSWQDILLVGEGNFSFAAALASAFKSAPSLVATSLDSRDILLQKYPNDFPDHLETMEKAGTDVMHDVNVHTMAKDKRLRRRKFDCIIYNFPHSGFVPCWRENSPALIKKHRELLRGFFKSAAKLLGEDGEIHVTHHVGWPYTEWKIEEAAVESGLRLARRPKFKAHAFPGYRNCRGAGAHWGRSFPIDNSATFIFST
ncbi:hypothetical protein L7F22_004355 [Adiantum nelumboides]|nr:hypothetical protein [Adiantum nelumboides]